MQVHVLSQLNQQQRVYILRILDESESEKLDDYLPESMFKT